MFIKVKARPVGTDEFQALYKRINTQTLTSFSRNDDNLVILTGKDRVQFTARQYYIDEPYEQMMKAIPQKAVKFVDLPAAKK